MPMPCAWLSVTSEISCVGGFPTNLKCEAFAFTAAGPASRDFKYRDQIRDSSAAAPRDISEGFGRFRPREFARFLEFARASLMETQSSLIDGRDRGYLTVGLLLAPLQSCARGAHSHNEPDAVQTTASKRELVEAKETGSVASRL